MTNETTARNENVAAAKLAGERYHLVRAMCSLIELVTNKEMKMFRLFDEYGRQLVMYRDSVVRYEASDISKDRYHEGWTIGHTSNRRADDLYPEQVESQVFYDTRESALAAIEEGHFSNFTETNVILNRWVR